MIVSMGETRRAEITNFTGGSEASAFSFEILRIGARSGGLCAAGCFLWRIPSTVPSERVPNYRAPALNQKYSYGTACLSYRNFSEMPISRSPPPR